MKIYNKYIELLRDHSTSSDETRFAAKQLLQLHSEVAWRDNPTVVELGVDKGQSTKVFLNAISEKSNANLISVDIRNCSDAVRSEAWEFVQQDSSDVQKLVAKKPILKEGIDVLYIDSLHTAEHVEKEVFGFFEYIKEGGVIFFDDVDSSPYMNGQRKDSVMVEVANRKILKLLEAIFRGNHVSVDFSINHGSTGLAKFVKCSPLGCKLNEPIYIRERRFKWFWLIYDKITFKKVYRHNYDANDASIINDYNDNYE